jgi:hypothetical protein
VPVLLQSACIHLLCSPSLCAHSASLHPQIHSLRHTHAHSPPPRASTTQKRSYGGICDPTFNVGFNTGVNFGSIVTPFVASLVFAHEVGHNWGAEHDPLSAICSPGDDNGGNYIMFAAASDGSKANNGQFSMCSTQQMSRVVSFLRKGCFVEAGVGCGDGEVSGDEECDCGEECTPTSCCTSDCRVNRQLYQCSPQNPIRFPCCTLQCMYTAKNTKCHTADACGGNAYCTGANASCPTWNKGDNTPCNCIDGNCTTHPNTHPQVCSRGTCSKYVCELYGAVQCGLASDQSCELGCRGQGWGDGFECVSTFDSSKRPSGFVGGRHYVPGTPCRKNLGRCNVNGDCVAVDTADGVSQSPSSMTIVNENAMTIFLCIAGGILFVLVVMHWRQHRALKKKFCESERAYLLAAANAEAEANEQMLLGPNAHMARRDDFDEDEHEPEYALIGPGFEGYQPPSITTTSRPDGVVTNTNYMSLSGSSRTSSSESRTNSGYMDISAS